MGKEMSERSFQTYFTCGYALLTGILGVVVLTVLFGHSGTSIDLYALLLFTVFALVVSYFRVPIYQREQRPRNESQGLPTLWDMELALDGAILLGATLAGGPALGGWTAFISGLFSPILPTSLSSQDAHTTRARAARERGPTLASWMESAAMAMLDAGRNAIAVAAAWAAYHGLQEIPNLIHVSTLQALALMILFAVYALVRNLWTWPALVLAGSPIREAAERLLAPGRVLVELLPLPISLLIASTFVYLGWSNFLLLALAFIGTSAVMRQMVETIHTLREQIALQSLDQQTIKAIASTPPQVDDLCALAYTLCDDLAPADKFEIGLYVGEQVHIRVAVTGDARLPPMSIPRTSLWQWLAECREPIWCPTSIQLAALPVTLPPIVQGTNAQSAVFLPLARTGADKGQGNGGGPENGFPLGAIVLQSAHAQAFQERDISRLVTVTDRIGAALVAVCPPRPAAVVASVLDSDDRQGR
jgi:hypothetical protein